MRLWHLGDDIGIVSFKTKMNTINDDVLDGLPRAIDEAERNCKALVLWQTGEPFSAGADLKGALAPAARPASSPSSKTMIANFQRDAACASSIRSCRSSPRCAAWRSAAAASSRCTATRTVAALESYIGLVEAGVGLLPAGGGLKEIALRASRAARRRRSVPAAQEDVRDRRDGEGLRQRARSQAAWATCATDDVVVFNAFELLYVAKQVAASLAESGWRPPLPARDIIAVAGDVGTATLQDDARQHARRPLHLRARLRDRLAHRRHAVRRRDRARHRSSTSNGCSIWSASTSSSWRRRRRRRIASRTR